jgi:Predicted glycosyltransferases
MTSACIVTYNSAEEVAAALDSLINAKADIFVVDNASTDGTPEMIKQKYPAVHLIQSENDGFGAGNNKVIPLLHSRYHVVMNPDVTFDKDLLLKMADYMDAHPETALLTPRVVFPNGKEQLLPKYRPSLHFLAAGMLEKFGWPFTAWRKKYTGGSMDLTKPAQVGFATGCFMFFRTEVFKQLNGFDETFFMYMEDADLTLRAKKLGKVIYHPDFSVIHAWKRESHSNKKLKKMHLDSVKLFMKKWGLKI